jgi:hypothetical protein
VKAVKTGKVGKLTNLTIPDEVYTRLTRFKGRLTDKTGKNFSYGSAITYLLDKEEKGETK